MPFLPAPFWCYFFPMAGATLGLLPLSSPLYPFLSRQLLPVCLALLLIGTDLRAVARMGGSALGLALAGTVLGGLAGYGLYRRWLPAESWGGIGALTGSWIGGSANLIAVKEALRVPDRIIAPLIIVDAGISYGWMALLIWSSSQQERWDRWIAAGPGCPVPPPGRGFACDRFERREGSSERKTPPEPQRSLTPLPGGSTACPTPPPNRPAIFGAVGLAVLLSLAAQWAAQQLPATAALNSSTWTVLIVTTAALGLSLTPLRRLEEAGASCAGTFALYVLLASIGARADLRAILQTPLFFALGLTWIALHGLCLLAAGRLLKAPLGLVAAASQANIGGPVSAPIVGAAFSKELAGIGLLMAVLGNILGTYAGLATALFAHRMMVR